MRFCESIFLTALVLSLINRGSDFSCIATSEVVVVGVVNMLCDHVGDRHLSQMNLTVKDRTYVTFYNKINS